MFETGVCWSRRLRRCRTHSIMPFGLIIGTDRASALQVCLGPALLLFFVELNFFLCRNPFRMNSQLVALVPMLVSAQSCLLLGLRRSLLEQILSWRNISPL
jgi:hypothetical protein